MDVISRHDAFLRAFSASFAVRAASERDVAATFTDSRRWTSFMLGAARDGEPEGALRAAATQWAANLESTPFSVHTQWYTLDLSVVSPPYDDARDYWATRTVLALEHENADDVETEMWKLAHWRADLSVLVFYDFSERDADDRLYSEDKALGAVARREWLTSKLASLTEIVSRIDAEGAERHLLLIGRRDGDGAVGWRFSAWRDGRFCAPTALAST